MNNAISTSSHSVLSRRKFISRAGDAGASTAERFAPARARSNGHPRVSDFQHGVASGDPLPDAAIIWTRLAANPAALPGSGLGGPEEVRWELSLDPRFARKAARGTVITTAAVDHTVKVDVRGLSPGR